MSLPAGSLPEAWNWLALALTLWALGRCVRAAAWRQLHDDGERLHVWLGAIVAVMLLRQIDATVAPGLTLHLLGATVLTLMFGLPLAIVALLAALAGGAAYAGQLDAALGPLALTTVLLPACVTEALRRAVGRWLPPHLFIYLFANAFFGGGIAMASTGIALACTALLAGAGDALADLLPVTLMMSWSEALLSGMLITAFAVYRPEWVATLADPAAGDARRG